MSFIMLFIIELNFHLLFILSTRSDGGSNEILANRLIDQLLFAQAIGEWLKD